LSISKPLERRFRFHFISRKIMTKGGKDGIGDQQTVARVHAVVRQSRFSLEKKKFDSEESQV
jgi:hypothetical protein